ncbi:MAG: hypothetical protein PHE74_03705 [Comamonas sp.]|nr:hypothetical protein [Comamonas sp.]
MAIPLTNLAQQMIENCLAAHQTGHADVDQYDQWWWHGSKTP